MSYDPGNPGYGNPGYGYPQQEQKRGSGMAITALVLGILALLLGIVLIGGVLGIVAIILGFIAAGRAKRGLAGGRGMAIAGIVLGVLGLLLSIGIVALGASFLNSDSGKTYQSCLNKANGDQTKVRECADEFSKNVTGG